jgi:hypothetical protein
VTLNEQFQIGANNYYTPNMMNLGAWGNYASITAKWTAPSSTFGTSGIGMYVSGEFGRQWLGTSDRFYGTQIPGQIYQFGIPEPSYNTWNIGVGFTYKVFTLICATPTPIFPRERATPTPATSLQAFPARPMSRSSTPVGLARTGVARLASPNSRLT